ncbi:type II toxin-antitoxin system VapC family toxin [Singulisphaera rosea]
MRLILDSCVGLKCLLKEDDSDRANRVRDDFIAGKHDLIAPDIFPIEVVHSLTRAERQLRITPVEGASHLKTMFATLPALHPYLLLLPRAYQISSQSRQGVYDCRYVALAEREGCDLLAADDKLIRNLGKLFPFIRDLASMP